MRLRRLQRVATGFRSFVGRASFATLMLAGIDGLQASEQLHVIGLVERMCPGERRCFDLDVKPEYREIAGKSLRVRFADVEQIYDPENYRLTLAQQDIGPGSHLRLLLERDTASDERGWRAIVIWIGD